MKNTSNLLPTAILSILTLFLNACGSEHEIPDRSTPPVVITADLSEAHQTIAGFGGANQMWGTRFLTPPEVQTAFGNGEDQLGLSIFRVRIASNPDEWTRIVECTQEVQKLGAMILASPWSPPPALKSNNSDVGGYLLEENYKAFAEHLNSFIEFMSTNGVDVYAISIQNEPDIEVSYESCDWTAAQMRDFIKNYGDMITGAKIAAPESFNFNQAYTDVLLNDDGAVSNLDIVAGHIYGGGLNPYPLAEEKGKEIWMTEYLLNLNVGDWENIEEEVKWEETLTMLSTVNEAMLNNWNAYIWWYLRRYYSFIGDGDEGTTNGVVLKRGYAYSHFSKFIRPGYSRISVDINKGEGLELSAYTGDGKVIVEILNQEESFVSNVQVEIPAENILSATSYTTSLNLNMSSKELEIKDGKAVTNIPTKSITTIVLEME